MNSGEKAYRGYGQYCPLALAAELLGRRWTILIVSRIIEGCATFSEIHAGVHKISPSLLSTRLGELEHAGLITREKVETKNGHRYLPTDAGRALEGIFEQLGVWGQQWARDMDLDDLDIGFLAWSIHLRLNSELMPSGRTVLMFEFSGAPTEFKRFWIVNTDGKIDMCLKHPGFDFDLLINADLRRFVEAWRGIRDLREEIRTQRIKLTGPRALQRAFPDWLQLSMFAHIKRMATGHEKDASGQRPRRNAAQRRISGQ